MPNIKMAKKHVSVSNLLNEILNDDDAVLSASDIDSDDEQLVNSPSEAESLNDSSESDSEETHEMYPEHPGMHNRQSAGAGLSPGGEGVSLTTSSRAAAGAADGTSGYKSGSHGVGIRESVKEAWLATIFGIFAASVAIGLQFWNEGRAVKTFTALDEALRITKSIDSQQPIDPHLSQHLIHISGFLSTPQMTWDREFNVGVFAARLRRTVEMYQWIERKHKDKKSHGRVETSYSYDTEWSSTLADSNSFEQRLMYTNPKSIPVPSLNFTATEVSCGMYKFSPALVEKIDNFKPYLVSSAAHGLPDRVKVHGGLLYISEDPQRPRVGDMRIRYEYAGYSNPSSDSGDLSPDVVSVMGRLDGDTIRSYRSPTTGRDLLILYTGLYSAQVMLYGDVRYMYIIFLHPWVLRFTGWVVMLLGLGCVPHTITSLVMWVPVLRDLLALGVHTMNACLATSLSLAVFLFGYGYPWSVIICATILPYVLAYWLLRSYQRQTTAEQRRAW